MRGYSSFTSPKFSSFTGNFGLFLFQKFDKTDNYSI